MAEYQEYATQVAHEMEQLHIQNLCTDHNFLPSLQHSVQHAQQISRQFQTQLEGVDACAFHSVRHDGDNYHNHNNNNNDYDNNTQNNTTTTIEISTNASITQMKDADQDIDDDKKDDKEKEEHNEGEADTPEAPQNHKLHLELEQSVEEIAQWKHKLQQISDQNAQMTSKHSQLYETTQQAHTQDLQQIQQYNQNLKTQVKILQDFQTQRPHLQSNLNQLQHQIQVEQEQFQQQIQSMEQDFTKQMQQEQCKLQYDYTSLLSLEKKKRCSRHLRLSTGSNTSTASTCASSVTSSETATTSSPSLNTNNCSSSSSSSSSSNNNRSNTRRTVMESEQMRFELVYQSRERQKLQELISHQEQCQRNMKHSISNMEAQELRGVFQIYECKKQIQDMQDRLTMLQQQKQEQQQQQDLQKQEKENRLNHDDSHKDECLHDNPLSWNNLQQKINVLHSKKKRLQSVERDFHQFTKSLLDARSSLLTILLDVSRDVFKSYSIISLLPPSNTTTSTSSSSSNNFVTMDSDDILHAQEIIETIQKQTISNAATTKLLSNDTRNAICDSILNKVHSSCQRKLHSQSQSQSHTQSQSKEQHSCPNVSQSEDPSLSAYLAIVSFLDHDDDIPSDNDNYDHNSNSSRALLKSILLQRRSSKDENHVNVDRSHGVDMNDDDDDDDDDDRAMRKNSQVPRWSVSVHRGGHRAGGTLTNQLPQSNPLFQRTSHHLPKFQSDPKRRKQAFILPKIHGQVIL